MRREYDIRRDLDKCETKHLNTKGLSIICLSVLCILSPLFYLFVFNKGNIFDLIMSSVLIFLFTFLSVYNLYRYKKLTKSKKSLEREYKIATETPEERLQRMRSEKITRVLNDEK